MFIFYTTYNVDPTPQKHGPYNSQTDKLMPLTFWEHLYKVMHLILNIIVIAISLLFL